jgi:hypothetical protein
MRNRRDATRDADRELQMLMRKTGASVSQILTLLQIRSRLGLH